jgi:hypothetical protein
MTYFTLAVGLLIASRLEDTELVCDLRIGHKTRDLEAPSLDIYGRLLTVKR